MVTDPKIFLTAPLAPIYTNFNVGARAKIRDFLVKFFQQVPKSAFGNNLLPAQKIWSNFIGRAQKIIFDDLKKCRQNFRPPSRKSKIRPCPYIW